jgi:hypothetical protein
MFTFPLILPSGKSVRLREITNRDLFSIIKFCLAQDLEGLSDYLNINVFKEYKDLSIIDKLFCLIYLRSFSLGFDISISTQLDDKTATLTYDLTNVINTLESLPLDHTKTILVGDFTVMVDIPTSLYFKTPEEMYFNIIKSISFDGVTVDFCSITEDEKEKLLSFLPPTLTLKLNEYITELNGSLGSVCVIEKNSHGVGDNIKINVLSNQPLAFVQSIFSHDLSGFMQFMYHFVNKVGGTFNDFFNLTLTDTKYMLEFYKEEIEKQNDELKKNQPRVK